MEKDTNKHLLMFVNKFNNLRKKIEEIENKQNLYQLNNKRNRNYKDNNYYKKRNIEERNNHNFNININTIENNY